MEFRCPHCHQKNRLPVERLDQDPHCGGCKRALLAGPIEVEAAALPGFIQQHTVPVLIDFWAPWCGPCRTFAPIFTAAAQKHAGKLIFIKVDTEAHMAIGRQHRIQSIPTLVAFSKGQEIQRVSGVLPPAELDQWVKRLTA